MAAALRSFQEAVPILETLVRDNPSDSAAATQILPRERRAFPLPPFGERTSPSHIGASASLISPRTTRPSAGVPREGADALEGAGQRLPHGDRQFHGYLAVHLSTVGLLLDEMGQTTAALRLHQEALAIMDTRLRHFSGDTLRQSGRTPSIGSPRCKHKMDRIRRGHPLLRAGARRDPEAGPRPSPGRSVQTWPSDIGDKGLAGLYRKVGRYAEALALLDEAQELLEALPREWPTYHYHLACCLSLRIPPGTAGRIAQRTRERPPLR